MADANKAVVPAEGTKDRTWHVLQDVEGDRCPARWLGGLWALGGVTYCYPRTLAKDGWTYIGPVPEPAMEGGNG